MTNLVVLARLLATMPFKTPTPGNKNHRKNNKISRKLIKITGVIYRPDPMVISEENSLRLGKLQPNYLQFIKPCLCILDFMLEEEIFTFGQNNWV